MKTVKMKLVSYLIVPWAILTEKKEESQRRNEPHISSHVTLLFLVTSNLKKRVTTAPHATVVTLSSKNCNEEDLQTITTSVENKRKWRKHT